MGGLAEALAEALTLGGGVRSRGFEGAGAGSIGGALPTGSTTGSLGAAEVMAGTGKNRALPAASISIGVSAGAGGASVAGALATSPMSVAAR